MMTDSNSTQQPQPQQQVIAIRFGPSALGIDTTPKTKQSRSSTTKSMPTTPVNAVPDIFVMTSLGAIPANARGPKIPTAAKMSEEDAAKIQLQGLTIPFSRDWFGKVLTHPLLHKEFVKFVESEHCMENYRFYKALSEFEDLIAQRTILVTSTPKTKHLYNTARSKGATHSLVRFLRSSQNGKYSNNAMSLKEVLQSLDSMIPEEEANSKNGPSLTKQMEDTLAIILNLPHLPQEVNLDQGLRLAAENLHMTFLRPGAVEEVNVPSGTQARVAAAMQEMQQQGVEQGGYMDTDVFDEAADEVLRMLYSDTFKRFVAFRQRQLEVPPVPGSVTASAATSMFRGKQQQQQHQSLTNLKAETASIATSENEGSKASLSDKTTKKDSMSSRGPSRRASLVEALQEISNEDAFTFLAMAMIEQEKAAKAAAEANAAAQDVAKKPSLGGFLWRRNKA